MAVQIVLEVPGSTAAQRVAGVDAALEVFAQRSYRLERRGRALAALQARSRSSSLMRQQYSS